MRYSIRLILYCFIVLFIFSPPVLTKTTEFPTIALDEEIVGDLSVEEPYEFEIEKTRTVFICVKSSTKLDLTDQLSIHVQGTDYNTMHNLDSISSFPKVWSEKLIPGDYLVFLRGNVSGEYTLMVSTNDPRKSTESSTTTTIAEPENSVATSVSPTTVSKTDANIKESDANESPGMEIMRGIFVNTTSDLIVVGITTLIGLICGVNIINKKR